MLLAGVGGFFGTCCRFLVNRLFVVIWKEPFPLATFTINIVGCFLIGILYGILAKYSVGAPRLNALLIVGFCGGFTTFSTFSMETFKLTQGGQLPVALLYAAFSVICGFIAVWLGLIITKGSFPL